MSKYKICLLLGFVLVFYSCQDESGIRVPEKLGSLPLSDVITAEKAVDAIDELHDLPVASKKNIIAEYGAEKKDLLYISQYANASEAQEVLNLMIEKMMNSGNSPFTHIKELKAYKEKVYITLGMGAYHYIFCRDTYVLWLQTYQIFGREIPDSLRRLYPLTLVSGKQSGSKL